MNTKRLCMDRHWRFTLAPESVLPKTLTHETVYAYSKGAGAQGPAMLNFNDDSWERVTLPHDWQHLQPFDLTGISSHGYQPTGVGWYRRTFQLPEEAKDAEAALEFEGISGVSDVYVNGAKLMHNESCYNGFSICISDIANFGATPNVVAVRVDKTAWEGWWYEGCGVNRHVWLAIKPVVHLAHDGVWVKPVKEPEGWRVRCEWTVENGCHQDAEFTVDFRALAPDGTELMRQSIPARAEAYGQTVVSAEWMVERPALWDVDAPLCHKLETTITSAFGTDAETTVFGFRTLRVDAETGFWLNGRRIKLLGTCNHQDHAGIGAAIPKELWRWRVMQLKGMGSNAYRCSHNPPPKALLEACDELGMLVMDENRSFSTSADALGLLESMVRRDRNHPCVAIYSLFNEEPMQSSSKGMRLVRRQRAALRRLDDTRPIAGAMNGGIFEEQGASAALDITGVNYFLDSYDRFHALYPDRPILSSETVSAFSTRGCCEADEVAQRFNNYDEACADWGETVREANTAILKRDFVMGMFVWTGFDYRGESTPYEWPSVSSHFGVMDTCGFPKDTYWLYRAYWSAEPSVHLLPHWNHRAGQTVRVMTYSNCGELELRLNGRSLGRRKNDMDTQLEWQVPFEAGELCAIGYRDGARVAEDCVRTAGAAARLIAETPIGTLYRDTDSVALINLSCVDAQGVFCPLEKARVSIRVEHGRLMGVGNGNPNGHELGSEPSIRLFFGRAQAIVAADAQGSEPVAVTLTADGLPPVVLTLSVGERAYPPDAPETHMRMLADWRVSHAATLEKPDVMTGLTFGDMNSMEPVSFTGNAQPVFDGKPGAYALYRAVADVGASAWGRYLVLNRVQGTAEVYAGKKLLGREAHFTEGKMEVELPVTLCGEQVFSLIIQNDTVDKRAGVLEPVALIQTQTGAEGESS